VQVPPRLLYAYITRTAVVPHSLSDFARISTCKTCVLSVDFAVWLKTLHLQQKFNLQTNCASLGLRSSVFTVNMCGQMKIFMQFGLSAATVFHQLVHSYFRWQFHRCSHFTDMCLYCNYLNFVWRHLCVLLENVSFNICLHMLFQHISAAPCYSHEECQ
jgi:hypothetical protein